MTIILLAGMPGAGKEEFLKVAVDEGYEVVRMGDVVREESQKRDGERKDGETIGEFANRLRKKYHEGIWAEKTLEQIESKKTVIDGMRSLAEKKIFISELKTSPKTVAVHASPQTRYKRLKERGREDAPDSRDEFQERDYRELDWGLGKVIARADYMIINESSLSDYRKDVLQILKKIVRD